jgi:hypothetical protein
MIMSSLGFPQALIASIPHKVANAHAVENTPAYRTGGDSNPGIGICLKPGVP